MTNGTALNDCVLFKVCSACSPRQQDNRVCSTTMLCIVNVKKHFIRDTEECDWVSVVLIVTRLCDGRFRVRIPTKTSPKPPDTLWGPISLLFDGYRGSFPGTKRTRREVDYSCKSSAETKNKWRYNSSPPICRYGGGVGEAPGSSGPRDCYLPLTMYVEPWG